MVSRFFERAALAAAGTIACIAPAASAEPGRAARADLTAYEAGVAAGLNRLRRDPVRFAGSLERHRRLYEQNYLYLPGVDAPILTIEGVAAVDEAIAAARRARPRPELRVSPALSRAARAHAIEIGRAGTVDHDGRDGSQPHQRMERHGKVIGLSGENIGTGWGDASTMVMSLFIDDGVRGRGHRVNMLESKFRVVGIGCARHKRFGTVCVFDFAAGFSEKG
jgi:Cysteine-rich secretory protein family